ncbi:MAG: PQQ-binding-like beta-propeller repeat protein, partial [Candidatus Krumholzibacteria bacterium]|nr:PQQ-binding-like beta-propeller repeat protein [Candidatus Krumholzibacteria bacterium]
NREILRNSIFFPSFEVPTEKSIDLAVSRTFPAIHWNISDSSVREKKATTSKPGLKRISIPAAVGILTALIAIILVFRPFNRGKPVHLSTEPFALLTAGDNESAGKLHREEGGTVEPTGDGKRSVSLVESWKKSFRQPVTSSPVFYKGTIFFGCRDSTMYAFTKDGRLKWKHFSGNGIGASPCCVSGRVIGANYSGDVFCLDDEDGSEVWSFNAKAKIVSTPRAWKNLVLIGTMDGNLIALDLEDGKRLWSEKIGSAIWASVSIGDECIIAATTDCSLIKLDQGGKIIWRVKPGGGILSSPLCLETKNLIVFGTKDRYIYAYSLEKGNLMWRYATEGEMNGPPASDGKYIFAGSEDGKLYTLTLNGRLVWESDLGGSVLSRPLIIGETVFVTTYSNKLSGLKKDTGKIVGEYRTGSPVYSSPSHDGERIFFGSNGGIFYAVRLYNEDSE